MPQGNTQADLTERAHAVLWRHLYATVACPIYDAILADVVAALQSERGAAAAEAQEQIAAHFEKNAAAYKAAGYHDLAHDHEAIAEEVRCALASPPAPQEETR